MQHRCDFQKHVVRFLIPLREKKARDWPLVLSLASAASVGHAHGPHGFLPESLLLRRSWPSQWGKVGKPLWEGSYTECAKRGGNLSLANFQASKWKHHPHEVRRISFTQPFMKMKSWIKTNWVVQNDPVALQKGEHVSAADMELLLHGKALTLPAQWIPALRLLCPS